MMIKIKAPNAITAILLLSIVAIISIFPNNSNALEGGWATAGQVRARLISGTETYGPAAAFLTAMEVQMGQGWHTYWRVPGDSGLPPRFDWSGSENVESVEVLWPMPQRMQELDLTVFGYKDSVTFPLMIKTKMQYADVKLRLKLDIMVCNEICIPESLSLALDVTKGEGKAQPALRQIESIIKRYVPGEDGTNGVSINTVVLGPEAIAVSAISKQGFQNADIIVTVDEIAFTLKPEIIIDEQDKTRAMIKIPKPAEIADLNGFMTGKTLNLVLNAGRGVVNKNFKF
jgi:suppressor for copper-sensitivity B